MGMAANQARLMSITARRSDIELRAQQISAAKMRLSMATGQAAMDYSNALNSGSMTTITSDIEVTKQWLESHSYVLYNGTNESAPISGLSQGDIDALLAQNYKAYKAIVGQTTTGGGGGSTLSNTQIVDGLCQLFGAAWNTGNWLADSPVAQENGKFYLIFSDYAAGLYNANNTLEAAQLGIIPIGSYSEEDIAAALGVTGGGGGGGGGGQTTTTTTYVLVPTTVTEMVSQGGVDISAAQGQYDSYMTQLSAQEKILDMELTQIDTEHNAIKTEYDAIKSLIQDNTEKSFNVFG